jgi:Lipocalin-like domain
VTQWSSRRKWLVVFVACSLAAQAVSADDSSNVQGVWRLVAFDLEFQDTGERRAKFGNQPVDYIIFMPEKRISAYTEAEKRKAPETVEEQAAAHRTMYAGRGICTGNRESALLADVSSNSAALAKATAIRIGLPAVFLLPCDCANSALRAVHAASGSIGRPSRNVCRLS